MTPEGYEQAEKRLHWLKNVEMPRLEKALGDAREMGDLSENAEYDAARQEIWNTDQQIAALEDRLARAQVVDVKRAPVDSIAIGALVKIEDLGSQLKEEILLVGEGETRKEFDCVSIASPLGMAFIGKRVGEIAEVQAPRGMLRYKILEFRYP